MAVGFSLIPEGYGNLHYDGLVIGQASAARQPLTPNGKKFALGFDQSSITTKYVNQPLRSFNPISASFGLFLQSDQGEAPAVKGKIRVTPSAGPYGNLVTFSPAYKDCEFEPTTAGLSLPLPGLLNVACVTADCAPLKKCTFPSSWLKVEQLRFQIFPTLPDLSKLVPLLGSITTVGTTNMALDDFEYTTTPVGSGDRC